MINMKEKREIEIVKQRDRVREKETMVSGIKEEIGRKPGLRCRRKREQCAVEGNMRALRVFCSPRATSSACTKDFPRVSRKARIDILLYSPDFSKLLNFRPFRRVS